MKSNRELASVVRRAMQDKGLDKESLGQKLNPSAVMVNNLICGEVVRSPAEGNWSSKAWDHHLLDAERKFQARLAAMEV